MKEGIGFSVTINIIAIFFVITFAAIVGIVSYSKAFRANSKIVNSLEKYEGYNELSLAEINTQLGNLNYSSKANSSKRCSDSKNGGSLVELGNEQYNYCIYLTENEGKEGSRSHYSYGVVTYIEIDFGFLGLRLKIPVYAKSRRVYYFNK